jgi:hypothetical protein
MIGLACLDVRAPVQAKNYLVMSLNYPTISCCRPANENIILGLNKSEKIVRITILNASLFN